jgi:hypothetical protein
MSAEAVFSFNDTMRDINGVLKTFGSSFGDAGVFDIINLPLGAVVVGGELIVETAGVGPTAYTVAIGHSGSSTAFLAATDLKTLGRTALTGLGLAANDGKNVRITIASTVANATAGKFRIRVNYTTDGRITEVNPN